MLALPPQRPRTGILVLLLAVLLAITVYGAYAILSFDRPESGTGPYRAGSVTWVAGAGAVCAFLFGVVCLLTDGKIMIGRDRNWSGLGIVVFFAGILLAEAIVIATDAPDEIKLTSAGFSNPAPHLDGGGRLLFRNRTDRPLALCVGHAGVCEFAADRPDPLRPPYVVLARDAFVVVKFANTDADFPLTAVDAAGHPAGLPDAVVHVVHKEDTFTPVV